MVKETNGEIERGCVWDEEGRLRKDRNKREV